VCTEYIRHEHLELIKYSSIMIALQRHTVQTTFIYLFIYNYTYYPSRRVQLHITKF